MDERIGGSDKVKTYTKPIAPGRDAGGDYHLYCSSPTFDAAL
jgi:hypothetical protein